MSKELVQLCIDAQRGAVTEFSSKDTSEVIRKAFVDLIGTDKPDHRQFRKHAPELFEIMEIVLDEVVVDSWDKNTFFEQFVEYRDLNLGDTNEFYVEDKTMLSIAEVSEGHWDLRRQKLDIGDTFSVKIKTYGASVYADFKRFLAGRLDWGALIAKIAEAMKLKIASEIYASFMGTMAYLPAEFKHTGAFVEDELLDIIQQVQVSNNYAEVVIAGTKKALRQINASYSGASSFLVSENMKDSLNTTGTIDYYLGHRLLEIPQVHAPNSFNFTVDDNKLLILPANSKPIKFVREGNTMIKEVSDGLTNMDMSMEYKVLNKMGIAVVYNNLFGMYELS